MRGLPEILVKALVLTLIVAAIAGGVLLLRELAAVLALGGA